MILTRPSFQKWLNPMPLSTDLTGKYSRFGRGGKGTIIVTGVGNDSKRRNNCNYDELSGDPHVLTVGAVDKYGVDVTGYYSNFLSTDIRIHFLMILSILSVDCANTIVSAFGSSQGHPDKMVTTDLRSKVSFFKMYTLTFTLFVADRTAIRHQIVLNILMADRILPLRSSRVSLR